jgi:PAS domain S-box-containing protein
MPANQKINILMVDDQLGKLLSYEAILKDLGENLISVTTGQQALDVLLKNEVAIVLMDVSMPDLDGFELADMIHQHPRFQKIAIIFISAVHLTDLDRLKGYQRGAMDYISVPIVPELLRAKVSLFADLYRKTQELERLNTELEQRVLARTEELRERADLMDLASEAIIVRHLDGSVRFWNAGAVDLYGWTAEEAVGRDLHRMLRTIFPASSEDIELTLMQGKRWEGNLVQFTKDDREVVTACRKSLQWDGGKRGVILEICRDITAQLQAEEALRKSEKMAAMGRMAGIVAHEINNPLAAITNVFYLLQNHPSLDAEARNYARMAEEELARVTHITRQTLGFYRESAQAIPVLLPDLLDSVLEFQSRQLERNGISVDRRYGSDGVANGFPGELKQVFLNLIGNAIESMPGGGRLRVRVGASNGSNGQPAGVRVSISDTGAGIRPEDAKRLFEPFFSTKSTKGTGLGLWISKGIMQKYDGSIRFRSVRLAGGNVTCFSVFMPTSSGLPQVPSKLVMEG